ncbi:MAG TPA: beta-propeller domain-containing protein [Allosphingosinicella sp.]|jgi:hypothetical protein
MPDGTAAAAPPPPVPGITNTQVAGVDEGGIVKLRGDTLVILRRGRLFTVSIAGGEMRPVSAIDAFPPGVDGSGDWYDEMLVSGDRVVVIGYSYRRGASEVNRFRLDADGRLSFEDSYQLKSNDYYSSRNYASRLIGSRLVLYSPLELRSEGDPLASLPGIRRWRAGAAPAGGFRRIAAARDVYVPAGLRGSRAKTIDTLHSVTSCDLAAPVLDCASRVVLGSSSRTFFVSQNAVYLWTEHDPVRRGGATALVYRLPFDSSRPSAVAARGAPVDQFSFMPDVRRAALQVLVRSERSGGDSMWSAEATHGDLALLSIPMAAFADGVREVPLRHYSPLPKPEGESWNLQNRFVGDHLLYGAPTPASGSVVAVSLADRSATRLALGHGVERLDAIGRDGIVIGTGGGALGFTAVDLRHATPRVAEEFRLPSAQQGETRSHSFFFRADPGSADGSAGILGLPVARNVPQPGSSPRLSAAMLFLRRSGGRLAQAGELAARATAGTQSDDGCVASCVDWYGNARPIFIGGRIFALLGYELVEGSEAGGRIREIGRTSFAPPAPAAPKPQ